MKISGSISFLMFIIVFSNCKNKSQKSFDKSSSLQKIELQKCNIKKEALINNILETKELQLYISQIIKYEESVSILKNEFLTSDLQIYSNKEKVILQDSLNITDTTLRLSFSSWSCKTQNISFSIWLPKEHAEIIGEANLDENIWLVKINGHYIID